MRVRGRRQFSLPELESRLRKEKLERDVGLERKYLYILEGDHDIHKVGITQRLYSRMLDFACKPPSSPSKRPKRLIEARLHQADDAAWLEDVVYAMYREAGVRDKSPNMRTDWYFLMHWQISDAILALEQIYGKPSLSFWRGSIEIGADFSARDEAA